MADAEIATHIGNVTSMTTMKNTPHTWNMLNTSHMGDNHTEQQMNSQPNSSAVNPPAYGQQYVYAPRQDRNVQEAGYYLPSGLRMPNGGIWTGPKRLGKSRRKRMVITITAIVLGACAVLGIFAAFADEALHSNESQTSLHTGVGMITVNTNGSITDSITDSIHALLH